MIRINSPGGVVAPTQELHTALRRVREAGKPVVASLGAVAASGGYYVAVAADRIYANPGTLTGSIGVIMQLANLESLFKKVGVDWVVVKAGQFKDIGNIARPMTPEERRVLQVAARRRPRPVHRGRRRGAQAGPGRGHDDRRWADLLGRPGPGQPHGRRTGRPGGRDRRSGHPGGAPDAAQDPHAQTALLDRRSCSAMPWASRDSARCPGWAPSGRSCPASRPRSISWTDLGVPASSKCLPKLTLFTSPC